MVIGHALPEQGWGDSSFKDMRGPIAKVFGVPHSRPRVQALCYLFFHPIAVALMFLFAQVHFAYKRVHSAFLFICVISSVYRASRYYHYAFGKKLTKALHAALLAAGHGTKKSA